MIDNKTLQTFLKTEGYYSGNIDGIFGPISYEAAHKALANAKVAAGTWSNSRTTIALNQLFLNKVMDAGLLVDGLMGQHTNDALYAYNASLISDATTVWPKQTDVRAKTSMFGKPGTDQAMVKLPYLMYGDYDRKLKVSEFQAHAKVVASLERIFAKILGYYGAEQIKKLNLDIFSGCYNYRNTTGSTTSLSMHAWGVAVDIDAAHNMMDESNSEAAFSKAVYAPFMDAWEAEGWVSLGRARNYDWMHFQAARL